MVSKRIYSTELLPGKRKFDFKFQLPGQIPPSINEQHGHIRYRVRVFFHKFLELAYDFKFYFDVNVPMNIKENPKLGFPCREESIQKICCLSCLSSTVSLIVTTTKSGFFVGQTIPIDLAIDNKSRCNVKTLVIYLVKKTRFTSMSPKKRTFTDWNIVDRLLVDRKIRRGQFENFIVNFMIPQTNPSMENKIIEIGYEILVQVKVSSRS